MSALSMQCADCGIDIEDVEHWPHDRHCDGITDPACICVRITCEGCCTDCNPQLKQARGTQ